MKQLVFFACTLLSLGASSQRSKIELVEIGIDQKALGAVEWPFDLPFYLTGTIDNSVVSLSFNYRIEDAALRSKKWISFPSPAAINSATGYLNTPKIWKRGLGDNTRFTLLCDGLHPNVKYNFKFELVRQVSLEDKLVAEMRTKLADEIKRFFRLKVSTRFRAADLSHENIVLSGIVNSYFPGKDLRKKSNTSTPFSFNAFTLNSFTGSALTQSQVVFDETSNYKNAVSDLLAEFNSVKNNILSDIDAIKAGKLKINKFSKEVLFLQFNPGLQEFNSYSLLDGLNLLRKMCLPGNNSLAQILNYSMRIDNTGFTQTGGQVHVESVRFIISLLRELGDGHIKDTIKGVEVSRFGYFTPLLKSSLRDAEQSIIRIAVAQTSLDKVESLLPDILSTIVQFDALESEVLPVVDIVSQNTPYISAEAGIGYAAPFGSVMHYQGANIYCVPIDKRAPLSSFRGWNRVWKSLSLQIGVSNFFGDRPKSMQSILGKSSSTDLNLALGWRLNRIIKINAGILPYRTNAQNILSDDYQTRAAGYFSIGLDVNVVKALGDVGKLLNL